MIKLIPDTFNPQLYNSVVDHPLQSWEWGEAREKTGIKILRIGQFKGSELKKAFLLTIHSIPFTNFKIGYIPRSSNPSKELLEFLSNISKKYKLVFIKFEPYVEKSEIRNPKFDSSLEALRAKWEINSKLKILKSKHPLFTDWTIISDISQDKEQLLSNLKPKTRYNINLALKKGVYIKEESNEKGYSIFETLYFQTINRQKYKGHNRTYHKKIWESLKNKMSHILIAYFENIPLAAYHIFIFKNRGYYVYGGSSDKYRNYMASNLLMWESLLFAKKNACDKFDMWGSLPKDYTNNHPWAGFTKFKEGYGGKFTEMIGSYDLILNPVIYKLYNIAFLIRDFILKF